MTAPAKVTLAALGFLGPPAVFFGIAITLGRLHRQFGASISSGAKATILLLVLGVLLLTCNRIIRWLSQLALRETLAPFWLGAAGLLIPPALFCGGIQAWGAFRCSKGREPFFFIGIAAALLVMMAVIAWTMTTPMSRFMPVLAGALICWALLRVWVRTAPACVGTFCLLHCIAIIVCVMIA
jgi:hypothetical protein